MRAAQSGSRGAAPDMITSMCACPCHDTAAWLGSCVVSGRGAEWSSLRRPAHVLQRLMPADPQHRLRMAHVWGACVARGGGGCGMMRSARAGQGRVATGTGVTLRLEGEALTCVTRLLLLCGGAEPLDEPPGNPPRPQWWSWRARRGRPPEAVRDPG